MLDVFGERQQELLRSLHQHKQGMTIDELATRLGVTRTAVKQHLVSLEQSGFVEKGALRLTKGRPGRAFKLASKGVDLFPKQYSWFSGLLLQAIKAERGSAGLREQLRELAGSIVRILAPRLQGAEGPARTHGIIEIMNELSYEAQYVKSDSSDRDVIEAHNCVYHHLAEEFPEVCQFDLELLTNLSKQHVDHQKCIIRGDNVCRFAFGKSEGTSAAKCPDDKE